MTDTKWAIMVVILIITVAGIIFVGSDALATHDCNVLSDNAGRQTQYRGGTCYIEIAPGMFVLPSDVVYWLDHVEPVRGTDGL